MATEPDKSDNCIYQMSKSKQVNAVVFLVGLQSQAQSNWPYDHLISVSFAYTTTERETADTICMRKRRVVIIYEDEAP